MGGEAMIKLTRYEHPTGYSCTHCHNESKVYFEMKIYDRTVVATFCPPCASRFGQELIHKAVQEVPSLTYP